MLMPQTTVASASVSSQKKKILISLILLCRPTTSLRSTTDFIEVCPYHEDIMFILCVISPVILRYNHLIAIIYMSLILLSLKNFTHRSYLVGHN